MELLKEIAKSPHIPSPPTVILKVLEKASQPECTIADLCQIIQMDPGLASNILRVVNSATFGLSRAVTSVQRALAVVGVNSARLLVMAISFPKMHKALKPDPVSKQRYWRSSIGAAIVAKELALHSGSHEAEDDMAAALLRDIGELILQQIFPNAFAELSAQPVDEFVQQQCDMEEQYYGLNHAEVSAFILDRWRLPSAITEAIRFHHNPDNGSFSTPQGENRAYTLYFATRAAQLLMFPDQPIILRDLLDVAKTRFNMDEKSLHEFLIPLSKKTNDFAALLQVDLGEQTDFLAVLARASEELVHLTLSANIDSQRAVEMTRRAESEARRWKYEAVFDPLTKVFNRRFLETRMQELFERLGAKGSSFGLMFIDLDGFKPLNDRFGHLFGDLVLQQVADCLNRVVRQGDIVARYGGDEFCILSEPMEEAGVKALGQRVWQKINDLVIRQNGNEGTVGASIGAIHCCPDSRWSSAEELLSVADKAMFQAKTRGKNRVVFLGSLTCKDDARDLFVESPRACSLVF